MKFSMYLNRRVFVMSLSAWRNFTSLAIQNMLSKDCDQTAQMCRLIWIFAGQACQSVLFSDAASQCSTTFDGYCMKTAFMQFADNVVPDQCAHLCSLIWAFLFVNIYYSNHQFCKQTTKALISLCLCAGWSGLVWSPNCIRASFNLHIQTDRGLSARL